MNSRSKPTGAGAVMVVAGRWMGLGCLLFLASAARADTTLAATNAWVFPFVSELPYSETLCTPAEGPDGTIYVGAFDGRFEAINPDGSERWHYQTGREIKSSPAVADDGTVYFGSRDRQFYALTPEGQLKWKFATGAWVDSSPAIAADGTVYFGSWDKNFYALNADGTLKWKFPTGGLVDSSAAVAADGTIYFGSHDKKFYALDAGGKPRWTFLTGAEITSSPAIGADGGIYFSSTDGNLYHLKPDGTEVWRCRIGGGSGSSPVLAENGNIVIGAGTRELIVSPSGGIIWNWGSSGWIDETAAVAQGVVCFRAPWQQIWAVTPEGNGLWQHNAVYTITSSLVIGNQGVIYFNCTRGLHALRPPAELLPAKSSWPMFRANARHTGRVQNN